MRLSRWHRLSEKRKRGFTLLETAIVMAIIGAIIGLLFSVAYLTQSKVNINQAADELNQISQNVRGLYAGRNTSYAALGPLNLIATAADFVKFTPTFVQQNVFPYEMLVPSATLGVTPCLGTVANNPWNYVPGACGGAALGSVQLALAGSAATPVQFVVRYTGINDAVCADLVAHNSLPGRATGLTQIQINGAVGGIAYSTLTPMPISSPVATALCTAGNTNVIDWYYNLNG
jgi:prepilin-type N-terminal cleavage/methylation domain-containing protein